MSETYKGLLAMVAACSIWGLSPIYYKPLSHVPATEVLCHRLFWSLVFFVGILAIQGRLRAIPEALNSPRRVGIIAIASGMISVNWFLFIYATQINRNAETSLGYYMFPLMAVLCGRFVFGEKLGKSQIVAIAMAILAVSILTWALSAVPWISLALAISFAIYGAIKKTLPVGPMVSVTCEVLLFMPIVIAILLSIYTQRPGAFGQSWQNTLLLIFAGPLTGMPLIFFSYAARRISMSTVGVMQYINPTLQFICAFVLFSEPFTSVQAVAFALIWSALIIYSVAAIRQDRAVRRSSMAAAGESTTLM